METCLEPLIVLEYPKVFQQEQQNQTGGGKGVWHPTLPTAGLYEGLHHCRGTQPATAAGA